MSKSGVPVVSQVAKIAGGENVLDTLINFNADVLYKPQSQALSFSDRASGGRIQQLPIVGELSKANRSYRENPTSENARKLYLESAKTSAQLYGAYALAPIVAPAIGTTELTATALTASASDKLLKGDVSGALGLLQTAASQVDIGFNPSDLVSQFSGAVGRLPRSPVENFQSPAQTLVYSAPSKISPILIFVAIAGVTFLVIKARKK